MRGEVVFLVLVLLGLSSAALFAAVAKTGKPKRGPYLIHPVGVVHIDGGEPVLEIDPEHADALTGLADFSHVWVFYWFDRNDTPEKRRVLKVHPRGNAKNPLTGVFATRSPVRPNLIALTLCKVVSVEGNRVRIDKIDALPGSPIVDLKPYIPGIDSKPNATVPAWVKR